MNKTTFSNFINSVKFQLYTKEDIMTELLAYVHDNQPTDMTWIKGKKYNLSIKDCQQIYILHTFKPEYIKSEMIKRLSQKTILRALNK